MSKLTIQVKRDNRTVATIGSSGGVITQSSARLHPATLDLLRYIHTTDDDPLTAADC